MHRTAPRCRLLSAAALVLACWSAAGLGQEPATTPSGGEPFHGVLQYRAKDAKLALVRPSFVPAEAAQLVDGVMVLGVTIGGEARAYPLYVLQNHQVVNDRLGRVPIAASW
jgi:hypothetical protein